MKGQSREDLRRAVEGDDAATVESLGWARGPVLDESLPSDGRPPLAAAPSVEMARVLLNLGASIEKLSQWWSPGFHLRNVDAGVAAFLVEKGARLTAHAAAGLGLAEALEGLLEADASLVHAKGGDGCTPLHFARNAGIVELLLTRGAQLDARDDDHASTPAQWLVGDAPELARLLIERGATPDLFLAAALGDLTVAAGLVKANPACLAYRIGKDPLHPIGYEGRGGTILQWTLGFNSYAHQIAYRKGHTGLFEWLYGESDSRTRCLVACVMARREDAERLSRENPDLVASLPEADLQLLARYCWETNVNLEAVRLMLDAGFPIAHPETSHGWSPLHNAAWGGYADLVELLIARGHPVNVRDPRYDATPLGFAIHCATVARRHPEGEYERVVGALIDAGSPWDPSIYPTGDERVDRALAARLG